MSALPTYVLVCDGNGCAERFVATIAVPRQVRQTRERAAAAGWTAEVVPSPPGQGIGWTRDICPGCTKKKEEA